MSAFRPGDIVEIETPEGLVYVHVTHDHPCYPLAVRGLPGVHPRRPPDLRELAAKPATFVALVPLESALAALEVRFEIVGNMPAASAEYPRFRMPVRDKSGRIIYWWYWDGRGLSYSSESDEAGENLPLRNVIGGQELMRLLAASDGETG